MNTRKSISQEISNLILESQDIATIEINESKIKAIFKDGSFWQWTLIDKDLWKFSIV